MTSTDLVERVARAVLPNAWANKDAGGSGVMLDNAIGESLRTARAAITALSSPDGLGDDVRRLVIAARRALEALDWASGDSERRLRLRALDQAAEAFASRVPWENEDAA